VYCGSCYLVTWSSFHWSKLSYSSVLYPIWSLDLVSYNSNHYYRKGFLHLANMTFYIGSGSDVKTIDVISLTHFTSVGHPMWKLGYHMRYLLYPMWNLTFNFILLKTNVDFTSVSRFNRCEKPLYHFGAVAKPMWNLFFFFFFSVLAHNLSYFFLHHKETCST
jgi:hypothetical protein